MAKRADRIAAKLADQIMAGQPMITKSAGTREQLTRTVYPAAVVIAELEKAVKRYSASMEQLTAKLAAMTQQVSGFSTVPGVTEVANRGWRPFDPQEDVLGLRPKQASASMNGYHDNGVGVTGQTPPAWHPESPGGM